MSLVVRFNQFAELELQEASDYYDQAAAGLREAFLAEIERCCRLLVEYPEIGVSLRQNVRKLVLDRFPYSLFYSIRDDSIRILAVGHQRRRPFYWRDKV